MYRKRKLASILSREIKRPYRDVLAYGRYTSYGCTEKLVLGGYTLYTVPDGLMLEHPTYPNDEEIVYKQIKIEGSRLDGK